MSFIASSLLLAAFCLLFVEVSDLLEEVWDYAPGAADVADGCRIVRRPPETPLLEAGFGLAPGLGPASPPGAKRVL